MGRCEPALGSQVRNAADETPALAGKLVASSLKSIQAIATMEGPEKDMPQSTQHGRFEPQSTLWHLGQCEGMRLDGPAESREIPFPKELERNVSSWRFGIGGRRLDARTLEEIDARWIELGCSAVALPI